MALPTIEEDTTEFSKIEIQGNMSVEMEMKGDKIKVSNGPKKRFITGPITETERRNEVINILNLRDMVDDDKTEVVASKKDVQNSKFVICKYSDSNKEISKINDKIILHDKKCIRSSHQRDGIYLERTSSEEKTGQVTDSNGRKSGFGIVLTIMMCILANFKTWTSNQLKNRDKRRNKHYLTLHNTKKKSHLEMDTLCKSLAMKENWIKTFQFIPRTDFQVFMLNPDEYNRYIKEKSNLRSSMKDAMQFEWCRLSSFVNYPQNSLSVIRLAEAGFHYQGNGDEVVCYFCGMKHKNWQKIDNPKMIHIKESPDCPFVLKHLKTTETPPGRQSTEARENQAESTEARKNQAESTAACGNQSESNEACGNQAESTGACGYQINVRNIQTTSNRKSSNVPDIPIELKEKDNVATTETLDMTRNKQTNAQTTTISDIMSQNGETHLSGQERTTIEFGSFSTNNTTGLIRIPENTSQGLRSSVPKNTPTTLSKRHNTSSAPNLSPNSFSSAANLEPMSMGVCTEKPKYQRYAVRATRLSSFANWPSYLTQTPDELSVAGFFYTGNYHLFE